MVNFLKRNVLKIALISFLVVMPVISLAQQGVDEDIGDSVSRCKAGTICNPINENTIQGFIRTFLEGILKIGIPIVALAIIYCGFLFVAARGKPEKITKAKDALLYTLIGAAILLGAWALAKLISDTVLAIG
jgi:hypothetical protein